MKPAGGLILWSNVAVPAVALSYPQLDAQIDPKLVKTRLNSAYTSYYALRFPYNASIPAIHIRFIEPKSIKIGALELKGYRLITSVPQQVLTIDFEASKCLQVMRPCIPILSYPKEALDHILTILELPRSGIEVTRVEDNWKLTWGNLKISVDENWTVQCYYIEFTHSRTLYQFYFDKKLRFFRNANTRDPVYLKHPLIRPEDINRILSIASENLNTSQDSVKITDISPSTEGADIGYLVTVNEGQCKLFFTCQPDYCKDPWPLNPPPIVRDSDLSNCLAQISARLKLPQSYLEITKLIRSTDNLKYTLEINNLTRFYIGFKNNTWKIISKEEFTPHT